MTIKKLEGNGLSLLANKCASRTFDISSGMVYASMRDQIVRAQLLIRDLHRSQPDCKKILVVGAGLAGVCAAAYAASLGLDVVVLESGSQPFSLQRKVTKRMVGPFMYEWPSMISNVQDYPLKRASVSKGMTCMPSWTSASPMSADAFVQKIMPWYRSLKRKGCAPKFYYKCRRAYTKWYVQSFVNTHSVSPEASVPAQSPAISLKDGTEFSPDYVILAVGMGIERVHLIDGTEHSPGCVKGTPFWKNDDLRDVPNMNWSVGVFGGGDGALQDVLRLITKHGHPLDFIHALQTGANSIEVQIKKWLPELETLEQQSRLLATWSQDVYDLIDKKCRNICRDLASDPGVLNKVLSEIRPGNGTVTHVHLGEHFTKAYLLNRFCVHLIEQCMSKKVPPGTVKYTRITNSHATKAEIDATGKNVVYLSTSKILKLDRVVVRFGPRKEEVEKRQIVKLTAKTKGDRTSMSAIPLPFVVAE